MFGLGFFWERQASQLDNARIVATDNVAGLLLLLLLIRGIHESKGIEDQVLQRECAAVDFLCTMHANQAKRKHI